MVIDDLSVTPLYDEDTGEKGKWVNGEKDEMARTA
jgi:hypothetical protein